MAYRIYRNYRSYRRLSIKCVRIISPYIRKGGLYASTLDTQIPVIPVNPVILVHPERAS